LIVQSVRSFTAKPKQRHGLKKGAELTAHEWFAQCMGCGTFGIKLVDDDRIEVLSDGNL
jgi:hypothetical protein